MKNLLIIIFSIFLANIKAQNTEQLHKIIISINGEKHIINDGGIINVNGN